MKNEDFELILQDKLTKIEKILAGKAKEYSHGMDRLHNFKVAARMKNETPIKACWGIAIKHLVSVDDLVNNRLESTEEMVDEKCIDMINYLLLLIALFHERRGE